ncbi:MAG: hypothetical protein V1779_13450 [bacterium]
MNNQYSKSYNISGSIEFIEDKVDKVFNIDGEIVVVDNIPAKLCKNAEKSGETLEHI